MFVNEPTTLRQLDGSQKLRIITDASSQPVIFTRGSNKVSIHIAVIVSQPRANCSQRLYCTVHLKGGHNGWQSVDITQRLSLHPE